MTYFRMCALVVFFFGPIASAETLEAVLIAAGIPTASLPTDKLHRRITSYAVKNGDPFLLAYYNDDGSGSLHYPIGVIRYDATTRDFRTADLSNLSAPFSIEPTISQPCIGSVLSISELYGNLYIDTHMNPSAGCVLILSDDLTLKAILSGWLEGVLGADYAIVHESEIHFASVHPMQLAAFDFARRELIQLYPPQIDLLREKFSRLIRAHLPTTKWCAQTNSQCDPLNFDSDLDGPIAVNSAAKVFGFVARFDAGGFGDSATKHLSPVNVAYFFRLSDGVWQYREFKMEELKKIFGLVQIQEIVSQKPGAIFAVHQ